MMTGAEMDLSGNIWMIILWVSIIGGGIWLMALLFPRVDGSPDAEPETTGDALAILKQRYTRGEISKEEFETVRHDIERV